MLSRSSIKRLIVGLFLCTASVGAQEAGPASDTFYSAIRDNDLTRLEALLKSGANSNAPDPRGGATPLMYAAAIGSVDAMTVLLDHGADVNASNVTGATSLMWAATEIEKVRLLLARQADVKAVSQRGRTALQNAARSDSSAAIARLLIDAGSDTKAVDGFKASVLHAAALGNDTATIRMIVDAGADVNGVDFAGATPLIHAAANRNLDAVRLLLARGADVNARSGDGSFQKVKAGSIALGYWTPLTASVALASSELVKTLLDAGAKVDVPDVRGMTGLMLAVANDRQNLDVIRLLLARGAKVNAKSGAGETALDWAVKIGSKPAIEVLRRAGGVETARAPIQIGVPAPSNVRGAVERSRGLLAKASVVSGANGGCASCHAHNIIDTVDRVAVKKGLVRDEKLTAQRQTLTKAPYFSAANLIERLDPAGSPITTVFALTALANSGYQPDRTTDVVAAHLASQQTSGGYWFMSATARPPIGEGPIAVTAYAIRALEAYAPPARSDMGARIARATEWLAAQKAVTTEDRNMQLLGLYWGGRTASERAPLAKTLLARQRKDGGWAQSSELESDAYATGVSLYALAETGAMTPGHPAYKKGIAHLLATQRADGSWYVKSRAVKFQPFFDGGFPYGHDQWISSMATGWAAAALVAAIESSR
jgi:ankyrin repeat protein